MSVKDSRRLFEGQPGVGEGGSPARASLIILPEDAEEMRRSEVRSGRGPGCRQPRKTRADLSACMSTKECSSTAFRPRHAPSVF